MHAFGQSAVEYQVHFYVSNFVRRFAIESIVRERVSLVEQMELVARAVRRAGRVSFLELCAGLDRLAVIVTFLAILELVRRERIVVVQAEAFADIELLGVPEGDRAA